MCMSEVTKQNDYHSTRIGAQSKEDQDHKTSSVAIAI